MNKSLLQKLLDYYGINYQDYLALTQEVSLDNFCCGHHFDQIEEAGECVKKAMKEEKKIMIYGDYDTDGIMATSILKKTFDTLFYPVSYYIPNRYQDGYGLNLTKAQEFIDNGIEMVITVDNGVTANEPIHLLKENHVQVLVLDHHTPENQLPEADYILHPFLSHFGKTATSGGFVSFIFSSVLLGYFDPYLASLASISLISDMMPLKEYNRNLLRVTFSSFQPGLYPSIDALGEGEGFNETVIGMKISPRINSLGRLIDNSSINEIVKFFTSDDRDYILNYFNYLDTLNENRKNLSKEAIENLDVDLSNHAICAELNIKEGLIGLVANNLVNQYHKPTIIFAPDTSGKILKGSARAPKGYHLLSLFNALKDLLITYGGHALAGGCSIAKENYEEFKEKWNSVASETEVKIEEKEPILLSFIDLDMDSYELVSSFSPFGEEWKEPFFRLSRIRSDALTFSKNNEHILTQVGFSTRLVGFHFPKEEVLKNTYIDLIGSLRISSYRNVTNLEFFIKEIFQNN